MNHHAHPSEGQRGASHSGDTSVVAVSMPALSRLLARLSAVEAQRYGWVELQSRRVDRLGALRAHAEVIDFDSSQRRADTTELKFPPTFGLDGHRLRLQRIHS